MSLFRKFSPRSTRKLKTPQQYILSIIVVLLIASAGFAVKEAIGYQGVALMLLMVVSLLAMVFDILPVLVAAFLSALIWNFFFIPPVYTFHIDNAEDLFLFLMYFFIASVNAVLSNKINSINKKVRDK
jgi:two-component system sensor histidine kinase KdpD